MSTKEVETALECAYDAASDTDFRETGAALIIGSTYGNAESFQHDNLDTTGSHDIDVIMMPKSNYKLGEFFNEFSSFWRNYDKNARNEGMHTSTYSDSSHEVEANWITEQHEGSEGKIPGHAMLFPSVEDVKDIAPKGFHEAVNECHIPLHGSLDEANQETTPREVGDFISEYHGPSGALLSDAFPEEVQWRTIEQIVEYTEEHYGEIMDQESASEVQDEIERVANEGLETAQKTPQELHARHTNSINEDAVETLS